MSQDPGYSLRIEGEPGEVVGYLTFPGRPPPGTPGAVAHSYRLSELVGKYFGPEIVIDFDVNRYIVGIEIIE